MNDLQVLGTLKSAASHEMKNFLSLNRVKFQWLDIERDPEALSMVEAITSKWRENLPLLLFPDGAIMLAPTLVTVAEKVGIRTVASKPSYDLIIIGAGPAGLCAAVSAASEGLKTLIIEREATGGQAGTSSRIENYLGFPEGISGSELAQRFTDQAIRLGAEIMTGVAVTLLFTAAHHRCVRLDNGLTLSAHSIVIATGVSLKKLELPKVKELTGAGIYYGASLTEAPHYRGEHIFVVGGANSAGQGALCFAHYAQQVTMLVRGKTLEEGMSQYLVDQIRATSNIEVRTQSVVTEVMGHEYLTGISVKHTPSGAVEVFQTPAMFLFIGGVAHTHFMQNLVDCHESGFIYTGLRSANWKLERDPYLLETSVPGIFAAGDVRHDVVRRVASAVGQGATVVSLVHQYLKTIEGELK